MSARRQGALTERTCATCQWWDDYRSNGINYGVCRRYAPRPSNGNIGQHNSGLWPDTQPADWCGEHTPKENVACLSVLDAHAAEAAMRERAASAVDCACPGREKVLNVTANGTAQTNSAMRWTACGHATCGALEAAAIRALPLTTGDEP